MAELAAKWREVDLLRGFVAAVRMRFGLSRDSPAGTQLVRWLRWTDRHADRLDPLIEGDRLPPPYLRRTLWDTQAPVEWPPSAE